MDGDNAHACAWRPPRAAIKAMGRLGYAIRTRKFRCASKDIGLLWSAACAPRDIVVRQSKGVAGKGSRTGYIVVQVPTQHQETHQETVGAGLHGSGCTAGVVGRDFSGGGSGCAEDQCYNFPIDLTFLPLAEFWGQCWLPDAQEEMEEKQVWKGQDENEYEVRQEVLGRVVDKGVQKLDERVQDCAVCQRGGSGGGKDNQTTPATTAAVSSDGTPQKQCVRASPTSSATKVPPKPGVPKSRPHQASARVNAQ